jgi:hypothetical protein
LREPVVPGGSIEGCCRVVVAHALGYTDVDGNRLITTQVPAIQEIGMVIAIRQVTESATETEQTAAELARTAAQLQAIGGIWAGR